MTQGMGLGAGEDTLGTRRGHIHHLHSLREVQLAHEDSNQLPRGDSPCGHQVSPQEEQRQLQGQCRELGTQGHRVSAQPYVTVSPSPMPPCPFPRPPISCPSAPGHHVFMSPAPILLVPMSCHPDATVSLCPLARFHCVPVSPCPCHHVSHPCATIPVSPHPLFPCFHPLATTPNVASCCHVPMSPIPMPPHSHVSSPLPPCALAPSCVPTYPPFPHHCSLCPCAPKVPMSPYSTGPAPSCVGQRLHLLQLVFLGEALPDARGDTGLVPKGPDSLHGPQRLQGHCSGAGLCCPHLPCQVLGTQGTGGHLGVTAETRGSPWGHRGATTRMGGHTVDGRGHGVTTGSPWGHRGDRGSAQGHHGAMRGQGNHLMVTMGMGGGGTGKGQEEVTVGTGK